MTDCSPFAIVQTRKNVSIAAALYTLERHIRESVPISESSKPANKKPGISIDSWLENLTQSTKPDSEEDAEDEFAPNYKDRVIYLLGQEAEYDDFGLHAYKGRLQKDGSFRITAHNVRTDYQEYNKPKYITNSDIRLLNQISLSSGRMYGSSSIYIDSSMFANILLECISTGRVILKQSGSVHDRSTTYNPIGLGEDRVLSPSWKSTTNNALKPSILIEPEPDGLVYCTPKIYIDRSHNTVGKVNQTHSDSFIKQWLLGPSIPQDELDNVQHLIEKSVQATASETQDKPAPLGKPKLSTAIPQLPNQLTLENCTPTAEFSIERADVTSPSYLFINSDITNILIGSIRFNYDGHTIAAVPFSDTFLVTTSAEITTIYRDKESEENYLEKLENGPKIQISDAFDSNLVNKDYGSSLIFSESDSSNTHQWVAYISSEVPKLEAAGWTVNVGKLDYTLLDYDSFFEVMSQNELKNEWFRFDLGVEFNGEKFSLIPALANAIKSGMYENYDFDAAGGDLIAIPVDKKNTFINFPAKRFKLILDKVQDIFQHINGDGEIHIPQLRAAILIDDLDLEKSNKTH